MEIPTNEPNNQEPIHKRFMNHKLASVGIAVAVLAVATCIALWQKSVIETTENDGPTQDGIACDGLYIECHDERDWKMYSNTEYGFEFKYPQALSITEVTDQSKLMCGESFNPLGCISVRLEFTDGSTFAYNRFPQYDVVGIETKTLVDGKELIMIQRDNEYVIRLDNNHAADVRFINKGGDANYQLFNQILSTFKFTE